MGPLDRLPSHGPTASVEVPITQMGSLVLATVIGDLTDQQVTRFRARFMARLAREGVHSAVIDVSQMAIIDTFVSQALISCGTAARLMGVNIVVSGIRPATAMTLVELGIDFEGIATALNLSHALDLLGARVEETAH